MSDAFKLIVGANGLALLLALPVALVSCSGGGVASTSPTPTPTPTPVGWGLLSNGLRDKTKWPFDPASIWNTAIGSGALYQPAGITANNGGGYPTNFGPDEDVIVMAPTAPATQVYYSPVAWNGGDRCTPQGSLLASVPVPATYTLPSSGQNNSAAILMADGQTLNQNQPFTLCTAGGPATTLVVEASTSIYGDGPYGAHGGSGLSSVGGTIRYGEFTSGKIHHAMKMELWASQYYFCCTPHWPATVVDDYAKSNYKGTNPNLDPGSLLALPSGFDVSALATTPGKILAQAFKDYGAYVVDDTAWNDWALCTEQGPNGRVADEFATLYGFAFNPAQGSNTPFMQDMTSIFQSLQIVTNNSAASIGGGGTPRVAAPPAIGN